MANTNTPNELNLERSIVHLLHRLEQLAGDIFLEEMKTVGLTPRQFAVLLTVSENEGLSQTGLVTRTGIDRSTLADIIKRMLNKGLISRKRTKDDARAYSVRLTARGRDVLEKCIPAASEADARILEILPAKERDNFTKILLKIVEEAEKMAEKKKEEALQK